jgi:arylsulfatase
MEQRAPGTLRVWAEPFTALRTPKMFDLHADPYEQADITSNTYYGLVSRTALRRPGRQHGHGRISQDVQGLPAQSASSHLHDRSGHGKNEAEPQRAVSRGGS